ncbi:MAG TPA: hypothetical protein VLH85_09720 [Levilinea sp.]|nr:hypothetical protein [Levilinea sp.]
MKNFQRILIVVFIILSLGLLLIWAPWITSAYAENAVLHSFEYYWQ